MSVSSATTVAAYLASLPPERRRDISAVRKIIRANLPAGYRETMQYGMISYVVPLSTYRETYNGRPLAIVSLASQKNYGSIYLMGIYGEPAASKWFEAEYRKSGKRLDMGKSCVRFRTLEDLPLDLIGAAVARISVGRFVEIYEKSRQSGVRARPRRNSRPDRVTASGSRRR